MKEELKNPKEMTTKDLCAWIEWAEKEKLEWQSFILKLSEELKNRQYDHTRKNN